MINVKQIRDKALRLWNSGKVLQSLRGLDDIFPVRIPAGKPSASVLLDNFSDVAAWVEELRDNSGGQSATGYRLQMTEINHRSLGKQSIPHYVVFDDATNLVTFIKKQKEVDYFQQQLENIKNQLPELSTWCLQNPLKVIEYRQNWPKLISVVSHFQKHPQPKCYIRELEIEGIDSKFVEHHRGTLTRLLDAILDPSEFDSEITGLAHHGFERRYGLKYDPPMIRFRCLDDQISRQFGGIRDITLPLVEFSQLLPCWSQVFITENKINGLSFPLLPGSIVIFGLGYGISMLEEVSWLDDCKIFYWGDIDTHGFAILSALRDRYSHTESMLMDETTLLKFKSLWSKESASKRFGGKLRHLTEQEQSLFGLLQDDVHGKRIRLEQERIGYHWVLERISGSE